MARKICVTAADGQTGTTIAELLLTDDTFAKKIDAVIGLSMKPNDPNCKSLAKLGAAIVPHKPGTVREMVDVLEDTEADTICVIPPAHPDKFEITVELVEAAKKANIPNVCLISSAGCDLAEKDKQPRLREFVDIEQLVLSTKPDASTKAGHSPVVIRSADSFPCSSPNDQRSNQVLASSAGFYAENLLLYTPQIQKHQALSLPIGDVHKFSPVALGDVALVAAHVLSGEGPNGFDDKHRGQLITLTGPTLVNGKDLVNAANTSLGLHLKFENISRYRYPAKLFMSPSEAKRILAKQSEIDPSEQQYLLDYYSLVAEGKTNYISTLAFHAITGAHPEQPPDFFKAYAQEFSPQHHHVNKKRRLDGNK
ncbi:MAG: hypothetical protein Q9163_004504 [Psora crenata]